MARGNAIRAGRAFVELFAEAKPLVRGLRNAERDLKRYGANVAKIGAGMIAASAAIAAPLALSARAFAETGDQIAKMARRTSFTVESLSELGFAADRSGTSIESLETSIRRMQRTIHNAGRGLSTSTEALAALGLSFERLDGMRPDAQFALIADKLGQVQDATTRAALAMEVFGRSGTELLPLIEADMARLQARARALGLTIATEDATAAEKLKDAFTDLRAVVKRLQFAIGAAFAESLGRALERITQAIVAVREFVDRNRALVMLSISAAIALAGVGAALVSLGLALKVAGIGMGVLAGLFGFILSPIGLVVAAVAGLGYALVRYTDIGKAALAALVERFGTLLAFARATVGGIADALSSGDIGKAADVLWAALKFAWLAGTNALRKLWATFWGGLQATMATGWYGIIATAQGVWNKLVTGWDTAMDALLSAWEGFVNRILVGWQYVQAAAAKAWNYVKGLWERGFDVEAANLAVETARDAAIRGIAEYGSPESDARQRARNQDRARREREMARLAGELANVLDAIDAETASRVEGLTARLDKAREEWQEAIAEASEAREFNERMRAAIDDVNRRSREGAQQTAGAGAGLVAGAAGTFNAMALAGLAGASKAEERTATATEKTSRHTEQIEREVRRLNDGLAFA